MTPTLEERARERAKATVDLMWHVGAFVIINGFLWALDLTTNDGLTWAYWVTISWGIGLAFHLLAWFVDGRDVEARFTARYLRRLEADERSEHENGREAGDRQHT